MAKETITRTVLSNGLQIRLKRQIHQRTVSLGLFIYQGSQDEDMATSGITHFIEHVLFNPAHMPIYVRNRLNALLDAGSSYEAYTSKEYTRFVLTCLPKYLEQAIELLSLLVQNRQVHLEAVDHERPIILQEHAMAFSSSGVLKELLDNTIWGDRSLGLFVIGRKENISRFQCQDLEERLRLCYVPERTFLVALGPIDINQFEDMVCRHFEAWESSTHSIPEPVVLTEPRLTTLPTGSPRSDLLMGYLGVPFASADRSAMELLADILGGGMKSRLFLELRERQKLVYMVQAYPVSYLRGGYLAIKVNCNTADLKTVYGTIQIELDKLKTEGIDHAELSRAKAARTTALLGTLEHSAQHLQLLGRRAVLNDDFFVDLETRRIEAVRLEDILRMAQEIFNPDNIAIAGMGPTEEDVLQLV